MYNSTNNNRDNTNAKKKRIKIHKYESSGEIYIIIAYIKKTTYNCKNKKYKQ